MATDDLEWENERTEQIPGLKGDYSIELDLRGQPTKKPAQGITGSPAEIAALWPSVTNKAAIGEPDVLVFDPLGFSLREALVQAQFVHRVAQSAVEVMNEVSDRPPAVVLCGPSEDAERRRMLTAAVKVRFPDVPVVYASTHAKNQAAQKGARREGADAIFALPLHNAQDLVDALSPWVTPKARPAPLVSAAAPAATPAPPASSTRIERKTATPFQAPPTGRYGAAHGGQVSDPAAVPPKRPGAPPEAGSAPRAQATEVQSVRALKSDAPHTQKKTRLDTGFPKPFDGYSAQTIEAPDGELSFDDEKTAALSSQAVHDRNALGQKAAAPAAAQVRQQSAPQLVAPDMADAISPFLWSLNEVQEWVTQKAREGHLEAVHHARTLASVYQLLEQMSSKVGPKGKAKPKAGKKRKAPKSK